MSKGLEQTFLQRNIHMDSKHTTRCSTSLIITEMQIKAMREHLTPTRMATIKNKKKLPWWGCREPLCTASGNGHTVGGKMVQPLWEIVWRFLKKLKTELPYDPASFLLGMYPKELKRGSQRNICTSMFTRTIIHRSQEVPVT